LDILLQNEFSYYRLCSLGFNIEENTIIEAFASLNFDTVAVTGPHYSIARGAFAASGRVYTTEACAAPGDVYITGV
jgi:hypothetical protein